MLVAGLIGRGLVDEVYGMFPRGSGLQSDLVDSACYPLCPSGVPVVVLAVRFVFAS